MVGVEASGRLLAFFWVLNMYSFDKITYSLCALLHYFQGKYPHHAVWIIRHRPMFWMCKNSIYPWYFWQYTQLSPSLKAVTWIWIHPSDEKFDHMEVSLFLSLLPRQPLPHLPAAWSYTVTRHELMSQPSFIAIRIRFNSSSWAEDQALHNLSDAFGLPLANLPCPWPWWPSLHIQNLCVVGPKTSSFPLGFEWEVYILVV